MRIISKFSDFYDIGVSYGIDPTVVYKRTPTPLDLVAFAGHAGFGPNSEYNWRNLVERITGVGELLPSQKGSFYSLDHFTGISLFKVIGFCGYWYFGVVKDSGLFEEDRETFWSYSNQAVEHFRPSNDMPHARRVISKDILRDFLSNKPSYNLDPFVAFETPIIVISSNSLGEISVDKDVKLINYGFQSVMDPWSAFQEVNMFVTGIMGQSIPKTAHISDRDLRDAKGFDDMSFKKPKTKRR